MAVIVIFPEDALAVYTADTANTVMSIGKRKAKIIVFFTVFIHAAS